MQESRAQRSSYFDTRDALIHALYDAAEIEHQLMLQYLYAAFSLKKEPDERCSPSQLERVRRWASTLYLVARQEMEHLALVENILSGIGARPYFGRENIGAKGLISPYFRAENLAGKGSTAARAEPVDIPFSFERFDLRTIRRFVCFESPRFEELPPNRMPRWCFRTASGVVLCAPPDLGSDLPPGKSHLGVALLSRLEDALSGSGQPGLVHLLYAEIRRATHDLPDLFARPRPQARVKAEYPVHIFPVRDRASADAAIEFITKHGEGVYSEPSYNSHFTMFYDVCEELTALVDEDPDFEPARPLLSNPRPEHMRDPFTREVFLLFRFAYVSMLLQLTALYHNYVAEQHSRYPHFSLALAETVFAPFMTMVVRPLAEVLARLDVGDGMHTAGPDFTITADEQAMLACAPDHAADLVDIDYHLNRCKQIRDRLAELAGGVPGSAPAEVQRDLEYLHQSVHRITWNLAHIYQVGPIATP